MLTPVIVCTLAASTIHASLQKELSHPTFPQFLDTIFLYVNVAASFQVNLKGGKIYSMEFSRTEKVSEPRDYERFSYNWTNPVEEKAKAC